MPKQDVQQNDQEVDNLKEKESLTRVLAKMDELSKRIITLETENQRLSFAANKALLNVYDNRHQTEKIRGIHLATFRGKMVVAWTNLVTNICEKDGNGNWYENQKMNIIFFDGTMAENVPYMEWAQRTDNPVKAKVLEEKITKDKHVIYTVETERGEKLDIDLIYVNP